MYILMFYISIVIISLVKYYCINRVDRLFLVLSCIDILLEHFRRECLPSVVLYRIDGRYLVAVTGGDVALIL